MWSLPRAGARTSSWRCARRASSPPAAGRRSLPPLFGINSSCTASSSRTWTSRSANRKMKQSDLGIAVVGSGRIGTLRARLAAKHPSVRFLAVSDKDPARAKALAEQAGAQLHSGSNAEVINHPDVTAVVVSTPEQEHTEAVCMALERGLPVLVEKPIGFSLKDAGRILDLLKRTGGELRVGYSRRYKEC